MFWSRQLFHHPDRLVFSVRVPSSPDRRALCVSAFRYLLFRLSPPRRPPLSPVESALPQNAPIARLECALPITPHIKSFRIRIYRKRGRGAGATSHYPLPLPPCTLYPASVTQPPRSKAPCLKTTSHPQPHMQAPQRRQRMCR